MGRNGQSEKENGMEDEHKNNSQIADGGVFQITKNDKINSQAGSHHTKVKILALIMAQERHLPSYVSLCRSCRPVRLRG